MKTINISVAINMKQCQTLGEFLKTLPFPPAQEDAVRYSISDRVMSNLYFALVAICHQTTPHDKKPLQGYVNGTLRKGWDYLRERWIQAVEQNPLLVSPRSLAKIKGEDIESILFDKEEGSTISDACGRAEILNKLGKHMLQIEISDIWSLYEESNGLLMGQRKLIDLITDFEVYDADPVRKKLFFFLALMFNQGFWKYKDPQNLGTPVDYHEVRGHLRYKTVIILDDELRNKIQNRQKVTSEEDIAIRNSVFLAIMKISEISGRTPNDLHYFFWNIFRNCCTRDNAQCFSFSENSGLPERYQALFSQKCIFAETCKSAGLNEKVSDHVIDTDLY